MKLLMRDEYNFYPMGENFNLQRYKSQDLSSNTPRDIEHNETSKDDAIHSNDITNRLKGSNNNDVNAAVRKDLYNNEDNERNKITKKNNVNNSSNVKNIKNEYQSKKSGIKKQKKVFILGDSTFKYIQGWENLNPHKKIP